MTTTASAPPGPATSVDGGGWPTALLMAAPPDHRSLFSAVFVVVDLETTGGDPGTDRITEIGAVKVRAGEVVGEFATLIDPGMPIPPLVVELTGMTDALVHGAPRAAAVLPSFAEFSRGAVLVAHNAPFDIGFLQAESARCGTAMPLCPVVDTVVLARNVLSRDEAVDCRLQTLATLFRSATVPIHRALDDARATVDVLHGLIERLGTFGVHTVAELCEYRGPDGLRRRPIDLSP